MKQKRSSGNVVHLFQRLSVVYTASSFEETAPDTALDEEKMALRRTLQPSDGSRAVYAAAYAVRPTVPRRAAW